MPVLTALALTIGVIGGLLTFLSLGPAAATGVQIWAIFIGAASFFHCGGKEPGLRTSVINNIFGCAVAWVALMLVTHVPMAASLGLPAWAGICVGVMAAVLVIAANVPALSAIPAGVYGFASTAAFALLGAGELGALTVPSMKNPAIAVAVSLLIGVLYGYVSEKITGALVGGPRAAKA